ncbi:MAG: 50S ribosomal protein L34e [Candidatus Bathyarchaeia archaeon]
MPRPALRTRSRKRIYKALPGGKTTIHYKSEIPAPAKCRICNKPLSGFSRLNPSEISKLNKSRRRVSRIYGGSLCSECLKKGLKEAVRVSSSS